MLSTQRLHTVLDNFPRLTIALVGDLFLDRYLEIDAAADEPSIETDLTAYQVTRVRNSPGALGTVMNNLAALGVGRLLPVTVIGDDGHGYDLRRELEKLPVDPQHVLGDAARLTPTYTKPLRSEVGSGWRELNRLDVRTRGPLTPATETRLLRRLDEAFEQADGVIVLDQINEPEWGVLNRRVREQVERLARRAPDKLVLIDSRRRLGEFSFGFLKGNRDELLSAARIPKGDTADLSRAALELARRTGRPVFATMGESGILIGGPDGQSHHVPAVPVSGPIDIVGAGDSVTAALAASLLSGTAVREAAEVACLVASITIEQLGATGVASPAQVLNRRAEIETC